jgi:hypothetical protein
MVLLALVLVGLKGQSDVNPTSNCGSSTGLTLPGGGTSGLCSWLWFWGGGRFKGTVLCKSHLQLWVQYLFDAARRWDVRMVLLALVLVGLI